MKTYTVLPGDTMWDIAIIYGIKPNELIQANPEIKNPSFILPGQIINIPTSDSSTYIVKRGDTMWSIASKYGININDLIKLNPQIKNPAVVFPGQIIKISEPNSGVQIPGSSDNIRDLANEVVRLVNIERANANVPALSQNNELSNVATTKSKDFINNNYFSHNSPKYGSPFEMLKTFGIPFTAAAENIASGQGTASDVMNSWMNSSGHRANILNPTYNQIGVGVARDRDGKLFLTQLFVKN